MTKTGARGCSSAELRKEKQSRSKRWTSSMKRTPETSLARPSSLHSATLASTWARSSPEISPVSPEKRARKPCWRLLMTSISWRLTTCVVVLRFCSSPSGVETNLVALEMAS
jgi:hypothetical protein